MRGKLNPRQCLLEGFVTIGTLFSDYIPAHSNSPIDPTQVPQTRKFTKDTLRCMVRTQGHMKVHFVQTPRESLTYRLPCLFMQVQEHHEAQRPTQRAGTGTERARTCRTVPRQEATNGDTLSMGTEVCLLHTSNTSVPMFLLLAGTLYLTSRL